VGVKSEIRQQCGCLIIFKTLREMYDNLKECLFGIEFEVGETLKDGNKIIISVTVMTFRPAKCNFQKSFLRK